MDRRARNDIKPLPFTAGENDVDYNDYDKIRKILPIRESRSCFIGARTLANEMSCPICLDLLSQTMTAKECLHRFCSECITMALQRGNKECPTCRKKLVSKRSLRPDPNFDVLINKIWPDRSLYEQLQIIESANAKKKAEEEAREREESRKRSLEAQENEAQSKKRKEDDEEDFSEINCDDSQDQVLEDLDNNDANTDAIHEDFETNEDDAVFEGEIDLDARDMQDAEQVNVTPNVPPQAQDVDTFMLESGAPPTEELHPDEWDGYDTYDPYSGMHGLTAEQQEELQADIDELEILEYDYYESDDSDEEEGEGCDDDDDNDDDTEDNGDSLNIDDEDVDEDMVDTEVVDDAEDGQTSQDAPESSNTSQNADSVATSTRTENTSTEGTDSCQRNENAYGTEPSTSSVPLPLNGTAAPVSVQRQTSVITTSMNFNPNFEVKFESISPPVVDNGDTIDVEILPSQERKEGSDDDSESTTTTYSSSGCTSTTSEESSSISIIFSDDDEEFQLNTIFPTELPITDIEAAAMQPTTSGFASISQYPSSSPSAMPPPSSSTLPGPTSVILPGPSTAVPIGTSTSMIPGSTPPMMPVNSLSIMGAPPNSMMPGPSNSKMTLAPPPMMSGPSSSMIAGHSSTIHSNSPGLSGNGNGLVKLPPTSLSALAAGLPPCPDLDAVDRMPEGSADQIRPPCNMIPPAERLNHWLANSPSSPQSPEDMAVMPERRADDVDMMEPAISGSEEMEAELIPAHSLSQRECPEELLVPRYVRAKHDTKMAHLSEFIHLRAMEEAQSNQTDFDADPVPTIPQPKHFYVFSRNGGHHVKQIFLHETMTTASCAMTQGDHLVIFYDIDSIDLRTEKQSILSDVVPPHFLSLPTV